MLPLSPHDTEAIQGRIRKETRRLRKGFSALKITSHRVYLSLTTAKKEPLFNFFKKFLIVSVIFFSVLNKYF